MVGTLPWTITPSTGRAVRWRWRLDEVRDTIPFCYESCHLKRLFKDLCSTIQTRLMSLIDETYRRRLLYSQRADESAQMKSSASSMAMRSGSNQRKARI